MPADSPLRKLVTDCWDADPTRRPTMRRVLEVLKDCPFEDRDLNEEAGVPTYGCLTSASIGSVGLHRRGTREDE